MSPNKVAAFCDHLGKLKYFRYFNIGEFIEVD